MKKSLLTLSFILLGLALAIPASAQEVNGGMSGSFFNPDEAGSGINIEILEGNVANGYWYTYDLDGFQMWLLMSGSVSENSITGTLYYFEGMKFDTLNPEDRSDFVFGEFQITYSDCNNLEFLYEPSLLDFDGTPFPDGTSNMTRLTFPLGVQEQCDLAGGSASPLRQPYGGVYDGTVESDIAGLTVPATGVITENDKLWFLTENGLYFGTIYSTASGFSSRLSAVLFIGNVFPGGNSYGYMDVNGTLDDGQLTGVYETFNPETRSVIDSGTFQFDANEVYELGVSQSQLMGAWTSAQGGSFSVSSAGRIVGTDAEGCWYDGTITPVDQRFSVAHGSILISQCGALTGFKEVVGVLDENGDLTIAFAGGQTAGLTILSQ